MCQIVRIFPGPADHSASKKSLYGLRIAKFLGNDAEAPLLANLRLQTDRLRLQLMGGSRREVLRLERATDDLFNRTAPLGYRIFKQAVLLLTLVLPSKQFFRLRDWYSKSGLRRVRKWIADPPSDGHVIEGGSRDS